MCGWAINSKDFQSGVMENLYNFAIELMAAWPYIKTHIVLYAIQSTISIAGVRTVILLSHVGG